LHRQTWTQILAKKIHQQCNATERNLTHHCTNQTFNFNDPISDKPLTRAHAKLINYKNAAQLALLMLNEEVDLMIVK
jgi:hypothetical protein